MPFKTETCSEVLPSNSRIASGQGLKVGFAPVEAGGGVFDYVAGVPGVVEGALFAVGGDGELGGFKPSGWLMGEEQMRDDSEPEAGEGFVVAGGGGVLAADGFIEGADAGTDEGQDGVIAGDVKIPGRGGYVGAVGPFRFIEGAGLEVVEEAVEGLRSG